MNAEKDEIGIHIEAEPGLFYALNKMERILLRAILRRALSSGAAREFISLNLGEEYIQIGENLLEAMRGQEE